MQSLNTWSKTAMHFFQHVKDQQVSTYNHNFLAVIPSHYSKETPNCTLHAEKIAETVFFYLSICYCITIVPFF